MQTTITGLAMIDDQSSVTFLVPSAATKVRVPPNALAADTLVTSTIQDDWQPLLCQFIQGLKVTVLKECLEIGLPQTIVKNPFPNAIHDVPSPDEVTEFPGLGEFSKLFPDKNPSFTICTENPAGVDCYRLA